MAATLFKTRSNPALIAAMGLAIAPLDLSLLKGASPETLPTAPLRADTLYSVDEIKRGASFARFLRGWEGSLPNRSVVLTRLKDDGVLRPLRLSPLEERIFSLWQRVDARDLEVSLSLAHASIRNGSVSDARVFQRFTEPSRAHPGAAASTAVSTSEYERGLALCCVVVGSKLLDIEGPLTSSAKQYVDKQTPERSITISRALGALEVWKGLEVTSPAYYPTGKYLKYVKSQITQADIVAVPLLRELRVGPGEAALAGGLLSSAGAGVWALYRLFRGRNPQCPTNEPDGSSTSS